MAYAIEKRSTRFGNEIQEAVIPMADPTDLPMDQNHSIHSTPMNVDKLSLSLEHYPRFKKSSRQFKHGILVPTKKKKKHKGRLRHNPQGKEQRLKSTDSKNRGLQDEHQELSSL